MIAKNLKRIDCLVFEKLISKLSALNTDYQGKPNKHNSKILKKELTHNIFLRISKHIIIFGSHKAAPANESPCTVIPRPRCD